MRDPLPRVQRGLAAALRDRRTQLSAAAFVLTALACYLYVLVGNINNYDNIVCTPEGYGTGLRSGRWMLTLLGDTVGHAMGNFNLPLFNGLLGLVFLGLACQFLCFPSPYTITSSPSCWRPWPSGWRTGAAGAGSSARR